MSEFLRFWGLVLLVIILLVGLSIILMKVFKKHPMAKYIPTLLIWLLSILLFIYGRIFAQPMQDLGFYVMSMITGMGTFIALIITMVIDRVQSKNKKKK